MLRSLTTLGNFSAIFHKGDNFSYLLFAILHMNLPSEKGSTLKGNYLLPKEKDRTVLKVYQFS